MDYSYEKFEALFLSLPGFCQSNTSVDDETASRGPVFNPELVIAHCFKQFKQKDFHLPQSRRRIIILPRKEGPTPVNPTPEPQTLPQPTSSFKDLQARTIQEPPEDTRTWLSQRLKFRQELESFGNVDRWLQNKSSLTPSEAKILHMTHKEHEVQVTAHLTTTGATNKKNLQPTHQPVPQLHLPKPPALSALYSYLHSHKIKILQIFNKADQSENDSVSREKFIMALKAIGVPLGNQEIEDIVIYLSSLGKNNSITKYIVANTYRQWVLAQKRSMLLPTRDCMYPHPTPVPPLSRPWNKHGGGSLAHFLNVFSNFDEENTLRKSPDYRPAKQRVFQQHPSKNLAPQPSKTDLLTVPVVHTQMDARPSTLEEMKDVNKRYWERKWQSKVTIPFIQDREQCRWVHSRNKHVDDHCLPSTICGEMNELINLSRRDNFLVYLQCRKLCEYYGLPLTEDILIRALLYPGDKNIFQKDQVLPIRQPGGYYSDFKAFSPIQALLQSMGFKEPAAKKTDKKPPKEIKKIHFKEFEEFTRKLKAKRPRGPQQTHPNFFWPGHLLDKLQLYLPTMTVDRSLALFSCIQQRPSVYSAACHSNHWWPIRNRNYMTCAYYDAPKVFYLN